MVHHYQSRTRRCIKECLEPATHATSCFKIATHSVVHAAIFTEIHPECTLERLGLSTKDLRQFLFQGSSPQRDRSMPRPPGAGLIRQLFKITLVMIRPKSKALIFQIKGQIMHNSKSMNFKWNPNRSSSTAAQFDWLLCFCVTFFLFRHLIIIIMEKRQLCSSPIHRSVIGNRKISWKRAFVLDLKKIEIEVRISDV
jgi:hypothetical protein